MATIRKSGRGSRRFSNQMFALFFLLFSLPVLFPGLIRYISQQRETQDKLRESYIFALEDISSNVDQTFNNLATLATQIPSIPWVQGYINASTSRVQYEALDQLALQDQITELSIYKVTNSILHGIVLSFEDKKFVVSSYGRARSKDFYNAFFKVGDLTLDDWNSIFDEKNFMELIGPYDSTIYSSNKKLVICVTSLPAQERNPVAHLLFAIDCDKLAQMINDSPLFKNAEFNVYTMDGQLVAGNQAEGRNLSILSSTEKMPLYTTEGHNITYFADGQYFRYAVTMPLSSVQIINVRKISLVLLVIVLYLTFAIFMAYKLSRHLTRPVDRILQSIGGNGDESAGNDLVFLENAVHRLLEGEQVSRSQLDTFKPYAINTLLNQLLADETDAELYDENLYNLLGIQLYYRYYTVVCVLTGEDMFLCERLNPQFAAQYEEQYVSVYLCDLDARQKAIILNYDNKDLQKELAQSVHDKIARRVVVRAAGVGNQYEGNTYLVRSYEEAKYAQNCRALDGGTNILYYGDISSQKTEAIYMPNTDTIISSLISGDSDKAYQAALEQIDAVIGKETAPISTLNHLYYTIALIAPRTLAEQGFDASDLEADIAVIINEMSVSSMQNSLKTVYNKAATRLVSVNDAGTLSIHEVINYLKENYADPNCTLNTAAEYFNVSPSYLSRVFKNTANVGFLDYLNKYRIEKAKELLHHGVTILTIAQQVGFDNDATFRRLFKKYTGTTPSRYKTA